MKVILILIYLGYSGNSMTVAEFGSMKACESALITVKSLAILTSNIKGVCVLKNES